ncbi:MAG: UbiX family flavin prenyltransferase [Syntrophomonadaceae bacterium]|nr:UbiX family flavin prenyltransferase [Syntrophomonadaceae bacterium]
MARYIVVLTGASGVAYGIRLVKELLKRDNEIHLIVSDPACLVIQQELGWGFGDKLEDTFHKYLTGDNLFFYNNSDIGACLASGSFKTDGMIVIPCTMSTVSAIAHGVSKNLIERAADVVIKEKRPLILVPRETPLSVIHLRNLLCLAEMGVHIIPAMPGFYGNAQTIDNIIDFVVGKVMDAMGISHDIYKRYL